MEHPAPAPGQPAPVCVIVGVGPGNGAAFARRFATAGYRVALLARSDTFTRTLADELERAAVAYPCDATSSTDIAATFARIEAELGTVDVLVHNAGNAVLGGVETTRPEQLEQALRVNITGCLLAAQQVVPAMRRRRAGAIVVIGATASRRGAAGFLPFAAAKAGQRNLAESMARELGPSGIHVAHVVIDGVIDTPATRARLPDRAQHTWLAPSAIADAVFTLAHQPPSAWTFELDLRPAVERW